MSYIMAASREKDKGKRWEEGFDKLDHKSQLGATDYFADSK
jgi:hypothetical protein